MNWRHSEILKLINSYRHYECLWNTRNPDYKQMELRRTAWIALGKEFNKNVDEMKKKIKHLRNTYLVEKKKVDSTKDRPDQLTYEPHLYYFHQMSFLDPVVVLRSVTDLPDDPLSERRSPRAPVPERIIAAQKRQRLDSEDTVDEIPQEESTPSPKARLDSIDYSPKSSPRLQQFDTKPIVRRGHSNNVPKEHARKVMVRQPKPSKEDTFCAMLCSELMLLKSEDTYDNVTSDIFSAVKNAKMAERQMEDQAEDDDRNYKRRL